MKFEPREFTWEEVEFLGDTSHGRSYAEIARLFGERFGSQISKYHIVKILKRLGIKKNTIHARRYTEAEIRFIKRISPGRSYAEIARLFGERFNPPITNVQVKIFCARHGLRTGFVRRLSKGCVAYNRRPIGTERVKMGRVEVKLAEGVWKNRLAILWERANGEIPEGHMVIPADRDMHNMAPDNLLLVSLAELAFMNSNGLYSTDPNMTRLGHAMAKMRIIASKRAREEFKVSSYSVHKMKEEKRLKREGRDGKDTHVQA